MHYQPVAIILGSDGKPAKCRFVYCTINKSYEVRTMWLTESDMKFYFSQESTRTSLVKYQDGTWVFPTYSWLPVLDMYGHIVKDGVIVLGANACFFCSYKREGKDILGVYRVVDAFGKVREYSTATLLSVAKKTKANRLFCNLDYDCMSTRGFASSGMQTSVKIRDVSSDISSITSQMLNYDIKMDLGNILVHSDFCMHETVFIPDGWTSVFMDYISSTILHRLILPKHMQQFTLSGSDLKNLDTLVLPEYIDDDLYITLTNCESIREVVLPKYVGGKASITLRNFPLLGRICQYATPKHSGNLAVSIDNAVNLRVIDTPCYDFIAFGARNTGIKSVFCHDTQCLIADLDNVIEVVKRKE